MNENIPNIYHLPPDNIRTIMFKLADESMNDVCSARIASAAFNNPARDHRFIGTIDLMSVAYPIRRTQGLGEFNLTCENARNPSAVYLRGLAEFFIHRRVDCGLSLIGAASESGYTTATYAFDMISLTLSVDKATRKLSHVCSITRETATLMRMKLQQLPNHGVIYSLPHIFTYARGYVGEQGISFCRCKPFWWWNEEISSDDMCDTCFWSIEAARFCRSIPRTVFDWPMFNHPNPTTERSLYDIYIGMK